MVLFPNCKINLGLKVLRKRPDGFHDLATVFYPLPLTDALEVVTAPGARDAAIFLSGNALSGAAKDNICYKAWEMVKSDFPDLPAVHIHLHKTIPSGAGLGGGSADGAFMLLLLNKKYNLHLNQNQILEYALKLGSDCPFFILNRPSIAYGRGEQLQPVELSLSQYSILLVHPGIHVSTAKAFSLINPAEETTPISELVAKPVEEWKASLTNDFEQPVFGLHPELAAIKKALYGGGAIYASMSGSGSSFYGIFKKAQPPVIDWPPNYFVKWFE